MTDNNPQDKEPVWAPSRALHAPLRAWMFNFLLNQRVPVRRATRGATDSVSLSWANLWSCLWPASELRAALPWLTSFYKVSREPKQSTSCAVSCCVLYPKCFLCFTVLSFNEHTQSPGCCRGIISIGRQEPTPYSLVWVFPAPFPGQVHKTSIAFS